MINSSVNDTTINLANGKIGQHYLTSTMRRCQVNTSPEKFISKVSNVYHKIESAMYNDTHPEILQCGQPVLKKMLTEVIMLLPEKFSMLDMGCGTGYASKTLLDVCPTQRLQNVMCSDLSQEMVSISQKYLSKQNVKSRSFVGSIKELKNQNLLFDLIITNSVVHHISDLDRFFSSVMSLLKPGGVYVMGHEPSSRFMNNPECSQAYSNWRKLQNLRYSFRLIDPLFYKRFFEKYKQNYQPNILNRTCQELLRQGVISHPLTNREVRMMVDIHVPCSLPGEFCIGLPGFDPERLTNSYLYNLELINWSSYNSWLVPRRWSKKAMQLAKEYPLDANSFSAYWKKKKI